MEYRIKRGKVKNRHTGRIKHLGTDWVLLRVETLNGMMDEVNKTLGTGGSLVWYIAGKGAGRSMVKILRKIPKDRESLEKTFNNFKDLYARWGWGLVKKVLFREKTGELIIRIWDNAFARGRHSQVPSCYFVKGYLEGLLETLTGKHATSEETKCIAKGDSYCEFQITLD